jgi:hypothetical protein
MLSKFETYEKRYSIFFSFRFYRFTEISFRLVSVAQEIRSVSFVFPFFPYRFVPFRFVSETLQKTHGF